MKAEEIVTKAKAVLEVMESQLLEAARLTDAIIETNPSNVVEYKGLRADLWLNLAEIYEKPEYDEKMKEYEGDMRD